MINEKNQLQATCKKNNEDIMESKTMISKLLSTLEETKKRLVEEKVNATQLISRHGDEMRSAQNTIEALKKKCEENADRITELENSQRNSVGDDFKISSEDIEGTEYEMVKQLKAKLLKSEKERKKLQNKVHELRGNVRVFVRCRPFLRGDEEYEACESDTIALKSAICCCEEANTISVSGFRNGVTNGSSVVSGQTFGFDQIFTNLSSQDKIFDSVSDLIQSALDGYRVCIFAYGQVCEHCIALVCG